MINAVLIPYLEFEAFKYVSRNMESKQTVAELKETFARLKLTDAIRKRTCYNCGKKGHPQMNFWKRQVLGAPKKAVNT